MQKPKIAYLLLVVIVAVVHSSFVNGENLILPRGGKVVIELIFSEAGFSNTLTLVEPGAAIALVDGKEAKGCQIDDEVTGLPDGLHIGSEKISQRGCRVILDANPNISGIQPFDANTTFVFNMCSQTDADTDCDDIWSTNPSENRDGQEHLDPDNLEWFNDNRAFLLAWEDLPIPDGDEDFDDLIAIVRIDDGNTDSDGDGLWDDWEQFGIDTNGDRDPDYLLQVDEDGNGDFSNAEKADPSRKDLFLEVDYMDCTISGPDNGMAICEDNHSHIPKQAAIDELKAAFADRGITLHVDISDPIPHRRFIRINERCGSLISSAQVVEFDDVAAQYFGGTGAMRNQSARRFAYRYAIMGHFHAKTTDVPNGDATGCAELPGNDLLVTLGTTHPTGTEESGDQLNDTCPDTGGRDSDNDGEVDTCVGDVNEQAGTLLHELGHTLGLEHGGFEDENFKPNYLSVMNYAFQADGIPPEVTASPLSGRVDYSGQVLGTLNENGSLNESVGIGNPENENDNTRYFCQTREDLQVSNRTQTMGAIDWNCNDSFSDIVSEDINRGDCNNDMPPTCGKNLLVGYDDWANLKFDMQATGDYGAGVHVFSKPLVELTFETLVFTVRRRGDLNSDNRVDREDLDIVLDSLGTPVGIDDRDLDQDGQVTGLDARILVTLCDEPGCRR